MTMFTTITALSVLAFQAPDPLLEGWKDFSPKGVHFRVKMPDLPKESARTVETPKGTVNLSLYVVEKNGVGYVVVRSVLPPAAVAGSPKTVLDEARDDGVKNSGGTLKEEKEIELDGHPGREMILELPDSRIRGGGIYRTRIYLVGRTHYQVIAASSKAKDQPRQVAAFLESFKLTDDGADAKREPKKTP
jgi:hypothetical protein